MKKVLKKNITKEQLFEKKFFFLSLCRDLPEISYGNSLRRFRPVSKNAGVSWQP